MTRPFLLELALPIAERHGIQVVAEPEFGAAAQFRYPDGQIRYLRGHILDLNRTITSTFARQRPLTLRTLRAAGYRVPRTAQYTTRRSDYLQAALRFARILGYPVVVKPGVKANGDQVHLAVSAAELERLIGQITRSRKSFVVQQSVSGVQVSVVVFDGEASLAFARAPLTVEGDGRRTVEALVQERLAAVAAEGWRVAIGPGDARVDEMLAARGLAREWVPAAGEAVQALLPAGPAFGGDLVDVGAALPEGLRIDAVAIVRHLGLRYGQVSFVLPGDDETGGGERPGGGGRSGAQERGPWFVLDVDESPDLQTFAELGPAQLEVVTALVERMILAMGKTKEPALPAGFKEGKTLAGRRIAAASLPFLIKVALPIARNHGIRIVRLPVWGGLRLEYPDGTVRHLHNNRFDLNTAASNDMARVKPWSLSFLRQAGFSIPEFDFFFSNRQARKVGSTKDEAAALDYADRLGYPVVVKPSSQSLGRGVHIAASRAALAEIVPAITRLDSMILVQRYVRGAEYRVVVLDGAVQLVWRKIPLEVVGDGERPIERLLAAHLANLKASGRNPTTTLDDPRVDSFLSSFGLSRGSVPQAGHVVQVGLTAGYSSGGRLEEARHLLPPDVEEAAVAIVKASGLRLSGLDIVVPPRSGAGGEAAKDPYYLLEVNGSALMVGYAAIGPEQHANVEALVERVVLAMGRAY